MSKIAPAGPVAGVLGLVPTPALGRRTFHPSYQFDGNPAVKVAFFDADSTLRVSKSGSVSANGPRDVRLLPGVAEKLAELSQEGYLIVIVSNQGGVADGFVTMEDADSALSYTGDLIRDGGGQVHYYDFAEGNGPDRKPDVGMADRLEQELEAAFGGEVYIDKETSIMVGDSAYKKNETRPDGRPGFNFSNSDRLFAERYGIAFLEPQDFFGWKQDGVDRFDKNEEVDKYWKARSAA